MKKLIILLLASLLNAVSTQVTFTSTWSPGRTTYGGVKGYFQFSNLYYGSCTILLPRPVKLFLGENFDIVPQKSDRQIGKYVIAAPHKPHSDDIFKFMINFYPGQYFTEDEVERVCDSAKETKLCVGSFPNSLTQNQAYSHIWYPGLKMRSELTIHFPQPVGDFVAYGADRTVKRSFMTYVLSGFRPGQDEVWFNFRYLKTRRRNRKFDATEITVREHYYPYRRRRQLSAFYKR